MRRAVVAGGTVLAPLLAACSAGSPSGVATNPVVTASTSQRSSASTSTVIAGSTRTVLSPLGLNIRSSDAPTAGVVASAEQGTVLAVLAVSQRNGGWIQVKGQSATGWISADPALSSAGHFSLYQSQARGFTALYPDTWTFLDQQGAAGVVFRPQGGGMQSVTVTTAASLDAVGPRGRQGYTLVSTSSVEVFGVTGVLRKYERTGSVASPPAGAPAALLHLEQIRVVIDGTHAIELDALYDDPEGSGTFRDIYHSVSFPPPQASPGASPTASPA